MEIDKKAIIGASAVLAGAVGAVVAYGVLGTKGNDEKETGGRSPVEKEAATVESGPVNLNKAAFSELMSLKHVGKGRAKRILSNRPFKSTDELVTRGILPQQVLERHLDRIVV